MLDRAWLQTAVLVMGLAAACQSVAASPPHPDVLDNAETAMCSADLRAKGALAAAQSARANTSPVTHFGGQPIDDPARRAFLRRELNDRVAAAQEGMARDAREEIALQQSQYRRLTGREFNLSLCAGGALRNTHGAAARAKQQSEMDAHAALRQRALADGERYRQDQIGMSSACGYRKVAESIKDRPPRQAAQVISPESLQSMKLASEQYLSAYRREHGKEFDFSKCR